MDQDRLAMGKNEGNDMVSPLVNVGDIYVKAQVRVIDKSEGFGNGILEELELYLFALSEVAYDLCSHHYLVVLSGFY